MMDSKTVLENFKANDDPLLTAIREALTAAESVPSCSQWIVAKEILEQALKEASDV